MFLLFFFICFLFSFFTIFTKSLTSFIGYVLIFILAFYVGGRDFGFDRDYEEYSRIFNLLISEQYVLNNLDYSNLELYEPTFFIIPISAAFVFGTVLGVKVSFLIFAFIALYFKITSIKKYGNFFLGIILYASYWLFSNEMTTIRAGVACAIFLYSIDDLEKNNDKGFFLKFLFALLFHYSSFVFLLCWVVVRAKVTIKYLYLALIGSLIIAFLKINLLTLLKLDVLIPKVKNYLYLMEILEEVSVNIFNFRILIAVGIIILFGFNYSVLEKNKYFPVLFKVHVFSVVLFFSLSPSAMVFSLRIFDLLSIVQLLLYPMVLSVFKIKQISYAIIFLICGVNLYYIINVSEWFLTYKSWIF